VLCICRHRWVKYYLSQDSQGPTVGVPYNYVAPDTAFVQWHIPAPLNRSTAQQAGWAAGPEEVSYSRWYSNVPVCNNLVSVCNNLVNSQVKQGVPA
jgi:hypothetical protein